MSLTNKLYIAGVLCYKPQKVCQLVCAVAVLHNYCIQNRLVVDEDNDVVQRHNVNQPPLAPANNDHAHPAVAMRRQLIAQLFGH